MAEEKKTILNREQKWGLFYFALFAIFIFAGIAVKRFLGHPEFMMMFHLPAAVFLVFAGKNISSRMQQSYRQHAQMEKL